MSKLDVSLLMQPPFVACKRDVSLRNIMVCSNVFLAAWFPCMSACSFEHLQLHQFCRWYAALSLFFPSVTIPTSLHWLNWAVQGEMQTKCSRGEKGKRNRSPRYTTASRLMNTKPLCLSHLEIGRWKLSYYFSLTFRFIFSLFSPCMNIYFVLHPPPPP